MSIRDRDLSAMLRLVAEGVRDGRDPQLPMPPTVLSGLSALLSCEISVFVLDSANGCASEAQESLADDEPDDGDAAFFEHYWDCAPCSYPDVSGDLDSVTMVSDFYSVRQYRDTGMWSEYVRPWEREMLACLGGVPGRTLRVVCWRGPGRDFTDRDRAVLTLLRPHLFEIYRRRRAARSDRPDLTPRQRQLLALVAAGHTNRQIGRQLGVSEATARKHLENIYERLGVHSRAAAVARVFPDRELLG